MIIGGKMYTQNQMRNEFMRTAIRLKARDALTSQHDPRFFVDLGFCTGLITVMNEETKDYLREQHGILQWVIAKAEKLDLSKFA